MGDICGAANQSAQKINGLGDTITNSHFPYQNKRPGRYNNEFTLSLIKINGLGAHLILAL